MIITKDALRDIFCTINGGQLKMVKDENDFLNLLWDKYFAFEEAMGSMPLQYVLVEDLIEVLIILMDPEIDS